VEKAYSLFETNIAYTRGMRSLLCCIVVVVALGVSSGAAAVNPPSLKEACGATSGLAARPVWLTTSDGVRLYTATAGGGSTAIVLAHEGGSTLCGALPYAATLVRAGLRVIAFDSATTVYQGAPASTGCCSGTISLLPPRMHAPPGRSVSS
jgi:hypothetical protein